MAPAAAHVYRGCGILFRSELFLPELPRVDGPVAADVEVRFGATPAELADARVHAAFLQASPHGALLRLPGVARCLVTEGRAIVIDRESGAADEDVRAFLLRSVFGVLLRQRGELVFRGAAIATPDAAALFLGASGAGKSTLAAALWRKGHAVLADDLCVVRPDEAGRPSVQPQFPFLKLWPESIAALDLAPAEWPTVRPGVDKRVVALGPGFSPVARVVKKIYLLRPSPVARIAFTRVGGLQMLPQLKRESATAGLSSLDAQAAAFPRLVQLARDSELVCVDRPAQPDGIGELARRIEEDLRA